jgi:hypothetical protein
METDNPGEGKTKESTKHTLPQGAPPQAAQTYETPEPKRRADEAAGRQEPSANPKRAPQHQPGYEERMRKEGKAQDPERQDDAVRRSQADDGKAEIDAKDDEDALHRQKGQRARTAQHKGEVKRSKAGKASKKVRKHK